MGFNYMVIYDRELYAPDFFLYLPVDSRHAPREGIIVVYDLCHVLPDLSVEVYMVMYGLCIFFYSFTILLF